MKFQIFISHWQHDSHTNTTKRLSNANRVKRNSWLVLSTSYKQNKMFFSSCVLASWFSSKNLLMDNFRTITASSRFIGKLVIIIIYEITTKVNKKTISIIFPKFERGKYFIAFIVKTMIWTLQLDVWLMLSVKYTKILLK